MHKIKTMNSHTGLARWLSETSAEPTGYIARKDTKHIPSPYRSSAVVPVYDWGNRKVVWFETRHRHYEVYDVSDIRWFATHEEAADWHFEKEDA